MAAKQLLIKMNGMKLTSSQWAGIWGISDAKVRFVHELWHGKWIYAPKTNNEKEMKQNRTS